jgi:hypothetical protein
MNDTDSVFEMNINTILPDGLDPEQIIVLMRHGSHLYGTDGPDSDIDWKGIYMPTRRQILTNNIPKSYSSHPKKSAEGIKNGKDDVDVEIYSLHYFLELAMKGETVAIDMLHAPLPWPVMSSPTWWNLNNQRDKFYTKNLKAFVGYARKQAAKYGIKGSRLNAAKRMMDFLKNHTHNTPGNKLKDVWNSLPEGEHIHKIDNPSGISTYQVCGKQIQETATVEYAYDIVARFHDQYGARVKLAAENKGIDWKAVSHALRAAYQVHSILEKGDITFPLEPAAFLKMVKAGDCEWRIVQDALESKMNEVEVLAEKAWHLPDEVDRAVWMDWLADTVDDHLCAVCDEYDIPF